MHSRFARVSLIKDTSNDSYVTCISYKASINFELLNDSYTHRQRSVKSNGGISDMRFIRVALQRTCRECRKRTAASCNILAWYKVYVWPTYGECDSDKSAYRKDNHGDPSPGWAHRARIREWNCFPPDYTRATLASFIAYLSVPLSLLRKSRLW